MLPRVILHNLGSLDRSLSNFDPNIGIYYQIVEKYNADATLETWALTQFSENRRLWRQSRYFVDGTKGYSPGVFQKLFKLREDTAFGFVKLSADSFSSINAA